MLSSSFQWHRWGHRTVTIVDVVVQWWWWKYSLRHIVVVTSVIDRKEGPGYSGGHNQNVVVVAVALWWYGLGHGNLLKVLPRVEVVWVTRPPWGLDEIFNLILYCTHTTTLNSTSVNFYGVTV